MDTITIIDPQNPRHIENRNGIRVDVEDLSKVSDGYHTIAELYDHRITLYIALCRIFQRREFTDKQKYGDSPDLAIWRSRKHSDGKPSYPGWFIMGIRKDEGSQISYHIPLDRWDETDFAETLDRAPEWDGHTSNDVLERLKHL